MSILVPTNEPGATEREYVAQGWQPQTLYVTRFYPKLVEDLTARTIYCLSFWRADQVPLGDSL